MTADLSRQAGWRAEIPQGVSEDAACLDGHFPGNPIVPGAMLLALAAQELADRGMVVTRLGRIKFLEPLLPARPLDMSFEISDTRATIVWRDGERVLAQAQMTVTTNDG